MTKKIVFTADMSHGSEQWRARYDAAFPDNLPVIPAGVGQGIAKMKSRGFSFLGALNYALNVTMTEWLSDASNQELFIRAWVLGVWRVEETGEIVKAEAEK
ncbi:hypothetical protein [Lacticaseibacillus zeae]|uniref:Uncharacterized protein n=1 Tax=Lacticaseibacillus zeae subsp. silagei TaxID=3068307 RepID=A0ABD7ZCM5_LACZE|nr:hypothetical protein [Lacticaseibacillus sp. NCIMB 15475]WLV84645.1 hypothetical protein LACZS2_001123 [Lacticaseibacillus sp. NCIMB 15475]